MKVSLSNVLKLKNSRKEYLRKEYLSYPHIELEPSIVQDYPDWARSIISSPTADSALKVHQNPSDLAFGTDYTSRYHD